jgi:hypothetical protein
MMTLIQALRREADILIMMQNEHLRLAAHFIEQWRVTEDAKWLGKAAKAQFRWEFNQEKIGWIEELLENHK